MFERECERECVRQCETEDVQGERDLQPVMGEIECVESRELHQPCRKCVQQILAEIQMLKPPQPAQR